MGCPIRKPWDQCSFAAPPGLSQLTASFIAAECQGIPRIPFLRSIKSRSLGIYVFPARLSKQPARIRRIFTISHRSTHRLSQYLTTLLFKSTASTNPPCLLTHLHALLPIFQRTWRDAAVRSSCISVLQWSCVDSNHGPQHYQCCALTT